MSIIQFEKLKTKEHQTRDVAPASGPYKNYTLSIDPNLQATHYAHSHWIYWSGTVDL